MNKNITVLNWGLIDYNRALDKQNELFDNSVEMKKNGISTANYLVYCQHPHVYTLGKSGDEHNMLLDYIKLQAVNAQFVHTNRGGDITYHGPGQLVGYPIFDLNNFNIGLKQYIFLLEQCIIELLEHYTIIGERLDGAAGVWLDVGKPTVRKICAIGVRSSRYVTMHGFALNVNTDLSYFNHINPCGFTDKGVTSMQVECSREFNLGEITDLLTNVFLKNFNNPNYLNGFLAT